MPYRPAVSGCSALSVEAGCPPLQAPRSTRKEGCRLPTCACSFASAGVAAAPDSSWGSGQLTLQRTVGGMWGQCCLWKTHFASESRLRPSCSQRLPKCLFPSLPRTSASSNARFRNALLQDLPRQEGTPSSLGTPRQRILRGSWCGSSLSALGHAKVACWALRDSSPFEQMFAE